MTRYIFTYLLMFEKSVLISLSFQTVITNNLPYVFGITQYIEFLATDYR